MKRITAILLSVILFATAYLPAYAETLRLPTGLKRIEDEAFMNDSSISKVELPEGITSIGANAFRGSGLTEINLPSSLTSIDDSALPEPGTMTVTAKKGTYAYDWAVDHGYIVPQAGYRLDFGGGHAVLNEDVIIARGSMNGDNYSIVSKKSIQVGDCVYMSDINDIVKVKSVNKISNNTYTVVRDDGAALTDYYQSLSYSDEFYVGESVVSKGGAEFGGTSVNLSYSDGPATISGSITQKIVFSINLDKFVMHNPLDVSLYLDTTGTLDMEITGEYKLLNKDKEPFAWQIGKGDIITNIPGINIGYDISVPFNFTAKAAVDFKTSIWARQGFKYNQESGMEKINDYDFDPSLDLKGEISTSLSIMAKFGPKTPNAKLGVIDAVIAGYVVGECGIKMTMKANEHFDDETTLEPDKLHGCIFCGALEGDIFYKLSAEFECKFTEKLRLKDGFTIAHIEVPLNKGYASLQNLPESLFGGKTKLEMGWFPNYKECPNYKYRTQIIALDERGEAVQIPVTIWKLTEDGQEERISSGTSTYTEYLYPGNYAVLAVYPNKTITKKFSITDKAESVFVEKYAYFGHYDQDNNTANGKEPIEWIILKNDGTYATMISRYALDAKPYNQPSGVPYCSTWDEYERYYPCTWSTCTLRSWLNSTFLDAAFSASEKSKMKAVTISNPDYTYRNVVPGGPDTTDKVYLLSVGEAEAFFDSDESRKCSPTDTAIANGCATWDGIYSVDGKHTCLWWLRSPGSTQYSAANVSCSGIVNYDGYIVFSDYYAVRPVVVVQLSAIS